MISAEGNVTLELEKRGDKKLKAGKAIGEGLVLGIVYGKGIKKNIPVVFSRINFLRALEKTGEGTLVKLKIDGDKLPKDAIIQDIQYHTFTEDVIHVDFMVVSLEEEVEVETPLEFTGVSPAVKDLGGIFVQNVENVEVRCKAKDIPRTITIDISRLATFNDMIYLKDVVVPAGVEILDNPELVVAMVDEPRSEKEMEELEQEATVDVSGVEGVKKEGEETPVVEEGKESESKKEETGESKLEENKKE